MGLPLGANGSAASDPTPAPTPVVKTACVPRDARPMSVASAATGPSTPPPAVAPPTVSIVRIARRAAGP